MAADFIVVCGDVFESNLIDRKVVLRACEAMSRAKVPIYLLPGNHDPLNITSPYNSAAFRESKPENVHIITDNEPFLVADNVELVGAPWRQRTSLSDLANEAAARLEPKPGIRRILVGHGESSTMAMGRLDPSIIEISSLEKHVALNAVTYVALGDRHSCGACGATGRIWYSGSLLATDFREVDPGNIILVDLDGEVKVTKHRITEWRFLEEEIEFNDDADLSLLETTLASVQWKDTTVLRLTLRGTLTLNGIGDMGTILSKHADVFAALEADDRGIVTAITEKDRMEYSGFVLATYDRLTTMAKGGGEEAAQAKDALSLLYRISRGQAK
jgi:DNA repair exonuclease SbcCD nuclease subunit